MCLGFDIGTSAVKALVVDEDQHVVEQASVGIEVGFGGTILIEPKPMEPQGNASSLGQSPGGKRCWRTC